MIILHTADWHLADRLRQIDRTADLERAVERVADCCRQRQVDVLLIAGDLFSELAKPQALQTSIAHLSQTFRPFLLSGGTIIALAGNHDNDIYCETLRRAFQLAAPNSARPGDVLPSGRFYLAVRPVHFQLTDRDQRAVQFACFPYPTIARYLPHASTSAFGDFQQRRELLQAEFLRRLQRIRAQLDPHRPRILAAHVNVITPRADALFRTDLDEDLLVDDPSMLHDWTYVALGHLHGPGSVRGLPHVRYSGSIERLSMAEKGQEKGVVLVHIQDESTAVDPQFIPLPATPFYDVLITDAARELPQLATHYPGAESALARCHVRYRPGEDDLHQILAAVSRTFPRCYERTWTASSDRKQTSGQTLDPRRGSDTHRDASLAISADGASSGPEYSWQFGDNARQTVLNYLAIRLQYDPHRDAIMAIARQLLEEMA